MLQAQRLVEAGLLLVDVERRHLRGVEDGEPIQRDLDRARRKLRVGGALGSGTHDALDLHDPFAPGRLGGSMSIRGVLRVRHHLRDAVTVAEVEEGKVTVVAAPMHPAGQRHALADMLGAKLATGVGTESGAHGPVMVADEHRAIMPRRCSDLAVPSRPSRTRACARSARPFGERSRSVRSDRRWSASRRG